MINFSVCSIELNPNQLIR